eukprot:SAG11_NODE_22581_length_403_cov_1.210526_1_plen_51_part_10
MGSVHVSRTIHTWEKVPATRHPVKFNSERFRSPDSSFLSSPFHVGWVGRIF